MNKLYFKYGAMGSSKTAQALMCRFNYIQKGFNVLLVKPSIDNRFETEGGEVISRIGLKADCIKFGKNESLTNLFAEQNKIKPVDVIIVDECHKCVGTPTQMTMFWKVLSGLSARYKIGLTATPKRNDGMEKAMYALLGDKFHEISHDQVKDKTVPKNIIGPIPTHWEPNFEEVLNPDGTLNYVSLITNCIENEDRNAVIASAINSAANDGPTLVLSERVAHLEILAKMCNHRQGNLSSAKKGERNGLLKDVHDGKVRVLFATYAMAKEGLDIPCLQHLIIASPIKDDIAVTQSAGRVMRGYDGKEVGNIWEFADEMTMLRKWLSKRISIYKRLSQ